jgi:hypothetical protein
MQSLSKNHGARPSVSTWQKFLVHGQPNNGDPGVYKGKAGGRYWDRTSDHIGHVPQLVEIPTWFTFNTIGQTFRDFDP